MTKISYTYSYNYFHAEQPELLGYKVVVKSRSMNLENLTDLLAFLNLFHLMNFVDLAEYSYIMNIMDLQSL